MDPSGADISSLCVTSTIPTLEPNVHVLGGGSGTLGEHLGQEVQPHGGIRPLYTRTGEDPSPRPM